MRFIYALFFLTSFVLARGQSPAELHPCGTPPFKSPWLERYQANPQAFDARSGTTLYVPLTIHLVGFDNGSGFLRYGELLETLHQLQLDFEPADVQFFLEGDIRRVTNSEWADHEIIRTGYEMMVANDVDSTINCYFVSNPAGNAGYNLPYASVAVALSATGLQDHTLAHEIGHNLSIQHPFLGWEGGVSWDGSVDHNYANPAPPTVLYNYTSFQQQPFFDTLIIDTALVELADGSNCALAADGFCDTPPDYLGFRWTCDPNGLSPIQQTDPAGEKFFSEGQYIMAYALDDCQAIFSTEQIGAMRANLLDEKPEYLYNQTPPQAMAGLPVQPLAPAPEALLDDSQVTFRWQDVAGADGYVLRTSLFPNFPTNNFTEEHLVWGDTSLTLDLLPNRTYYWQVRPFSRYEFGAGWSEGTSFETGALTSVLEWDAQHSGLLLAPQPVAAGTLLRVENESWEASQRLRVQWLDGTGRALASLQMRAGSLTQLRVPASFAPGLYILQVQADEGHWAEKVLVR